jgi:hypothetical protein
VSLSQRDLEWFEARLAIAAYDVNADYYRKVWEDIRMSLKLQGIAAKMAMLQHNVEADAERLDAAIEAADAKRQAVIPKAVAKIASTASQLADVESFVSSIEQVTNGGPVLEPVQTPLPADPGIVSQGEASGEVARSGAGGANVPGVTTY